MFSAFKRLTSKNEIQNGPQEAGPNTPMSGSLQKKFGRGVQYNSKYPHPLQTNKKLIPKNFLSSENNN